MTTEDIHYIEDDPYRADDWSEKDLDREIEEDDEDEDEDE